MYLKVGPDHKIYKRRAISGWNKVRYQYPNLVLYVDATMLYDGSILAVHTEWGSARAGHGFRAAGRGVSHAGDGRRGDDAAK